MKKSELQPLIDVLIPKLFSFAYALVPDELQAVQIVIDAYSVFVIREKEHLEYLKYNVKSKKDKAQTLQYLFKSNLKEIYKLGTKRSFQLKNTIDEKQDLPQFYQVEISQRALLFLKYKLSFDLNDIQQVLMIQRHQVLEKLYNGNNSLTQYQQEKEVQI